MTPDACDKPPMAAVQQGVRWLEWNPALFARARADNQLVYVCLVHPGCQRSHAMERVTLTDARVADFLNARFLCVRVSGFERPDMASVFRIYLDTIFNLKGWPINVFLTPDGRPFFGGLLFPPGAQGRSKSFLEILHHVQEAWQNRPAEVKATASDMFQRWQPAAAPLRAPGAYLAPPLMRQAVYVLKRNFDQVHGGFGPPPRWLQPEVHRFLLTHSRITRDGEALGMALHTCCRMAASALHDHVGGGFHRSTMDAAWRLPTFERTLVDNIRVARLYMDAHLVNTDLGFERVAMAALGFIREQLANQNGGWNAGLDSESSDGQKGFFAWTKRELENLLSPVEYAAFAAAYHVLPEGNYFDRSLPPSTQVLNNLHLANWPAIAPSDPALIGALQKVKEARSRRAAPAASSHVLAEGNAMMVGLLCQASSVFGSREFLAQARSAFEFVCGRFWDRRRRVVLHGIWPGQTAQAGPEFLGDVAQLLCASLDLYEHTLDEECLGMAVQLAQVLEERFFDHNQGGFWEMPVNQWETEMVSKPSDDTMNVSGNAAACQGLLRLYAITGRMKLRELADATLGVFIPRLANAPLTVAGLLMAATLRLVDVKRVVVSGSPEDPQTQQLLMATHGVFNSCKVVCGIKGPVAEDISKLDMPLDRPAVRILHGDRQHPAIFNQDQVRWFLR